MNMIAKSLETIPSSIAKSTTYARCIFAALTLGVVYKTAWFSRWGAWQQRNIVDFDAFHIIAQRVWLGDVDQAYQFEKLVNMQREASGGTDSFMPWTYPPQFDLFVAPLAFLPNGLAYFIFTATTLAFYLLMLRSIATSYFALVLVILFPAIQITMSCGQNGFLTAGLIGLVCLFIEKRQVLAGLALGLMVIKPHLAIAFAVYAVLTRRWIAVLTAGTVVLTSSLVCTAIFGFQIWTGLLQSVHDSAIFLERGYYPLFRMISFYAALRTAGLPAWAAFMGQAMVAVSALGIMAIALYREFPARWTLGLTAMVSVAVSPYAYDYDFPIFGIGLALLLPELTKAAREAERAIIYIAPIVIGAYGNLQSARSGTPHTDVECLDVLSIGGFALVSLLALIFMILLRGSTPETALGFSMEAGRLRRRLRHWRSLRA
jgi:hypothetical protein